MKPPLPHHPDEQRYGQLVLQFIRDLGYDPATIGYVAIRPGSVTIEQPPRPDHPFMRTTEIRIDTRERIAA